MSDLITRLEAASEGSRELDYEVWQVTTPGVTYRIEHVKHAHSDAEWDIHETRDVTGRLIIVPLYTTSLDAALARATQPKDPNDAR